MAREKAPAYQRYPKQIMGDDKVLLMDWDAYGMHNWLLDISWQQDPRGTIPDDTAVLRRWLRNPSDETWRRVWPQINTAWPILEGGRRGNAGMMRCAEKQENYRNGNRGKEKYANGTQIGTQITSGLVRKSTEDEDEVVIGLQVLKPDYKPAFLLEDFDPQTRFSALCGVYPKPNRSYLGMQAYQRAVESMVSVNRPDRNEIADAIEQAAAAYVQAKRGADKKYIPELIAWLDKGIWQQDPACWEETKVDGDGQRKQTAGDRYSAAVALRRANAANGKQLEKS